MAWDSAEIHRGAHPASFWVNFLFIVVLIFQLTGLQILLIELRLILEHPNELGLGFCGLRLLKSG